MKTKIYTLFFPNGTPVDLIAPEGILFPAQLVTAFGNYCGAGDGLGEKLIPDTNYGLRISAPCFIHDEMWAIAEPTWAEFHYSNSVFMHNHQQIVIAGSNSNFLKWLRTYRVATYFSSVDTVGADIFWRIKKEQGHPKPGND